MVEDPGWFSSTKIVGFGEPGLSRKSVHGEIDCRVESCEGAESDSEAMHVVGHLAQRA